MSDLSEGATSTYAFVTAEWARRRPTEDVWNVRTADATPSSRCWGNGIAV